jgi:hypothetical protein
MIQGKNHIVFQSVDQPDWNRLTLSSDSSLVVKTLKDSLTTVMNTSNEFVL